MNPDTLIKVLEWLVKAGLVLKKVKDAVSHPVIWYGLLMLLASYILYWLGFTNDLIFMIPFR
jgi:hypothetical protein